MSMVRNLTLSLALSAAPLGGAAAAAPTQLLNVSYDPTRELYQQVNAAFAKQWKQPITIKQSHGGTAERRRRKRERKRKIANHRHRRDSPVPMGSSANL